jgi:hypothetical protein
VSNLDLAKHVLRGLCAIANGVFLDSDEGELQQPVHGTADPVRREAVTRALRPSGDAGRRVEISQQAGEVLDCILQNPPSGSTLSPGESIVLAVARAALHAQLDSHELAVISYRESIVDFTFRRAIWELGVKQLQDMPHQVLKTLVIVCEAPIDIELYCQSGFGFRLAIDDSGRLLRRNDRQDLTTWARNIGRHKKPLVLFLGAGFSESSKLPGGNRLRDTAIRSLLGIDPEDRGFTSDDLANRFYDWIDDKHWLTEAEENMERAEYVRTLTLEQVVSAEKRHFGNVPTLEQFKQHHDAVINDPGAAVKHLVTVLKRAEGRIVVAEVNFDTLVEAHGPEDLKVFATDEEFAQAPAYIAQYLAGDVSGVPLLKLHGTIDRPESCIVSAEQTRKGLSQQKHEALRALLDPEEPRLWVYVGTSMRDRDLLAVFNGPDFRNGTDEVWANPFLNETIETYARGRVDTWKARRWTSIGDRLITEVADGFFDELNKEWQETKDAQGA